MFSQLYVVAATKKPPKLLLEKKTKQIERCNCIIAWETSEQARSSDLILINIFITAQIKQSLFNQRLRLMSSSELCNEPLTYF